MFYIYQDEHKIALLGLLQIPFVFRFLRLCNPLFFGLSLGFSWLGSLFLVSWGDLLAFFLFLPVHWCAGGFPVFWFLFSCGLWNVWFDYLLSGIWSLYYGGFPRVSLLRSSMPIIACFWFLWEAFSFSLIWSFSFYCIGSICAFWFLVSAGYRRSYSQQL